jgi:hypothetical protein
MVTHTTNLAIPGLNKLSGLESLNLSDNRKTKFFSGHKNTFGLRTGLPKYGGTCPSATFGEGGCLCGRGAKGEPTCYAAKLRRIYPNYGKTEDHNTDLLLNATYEEMVIIIRNTVMKWLLNGGHKKQYFRLHMGGDFFNETYTRAWKHVIDEWPLVKFWTYTRSMFALPILADCKNLSLYLSCDPANAEEVRKAYEPYKNYNNVAVAWMGNSFPEAVLNDRKYLKCPEVAKKLKSTKTEGACSRCRACIDRPLKDGKLRHIQFPIHK